MLQNTAPGFKKFVVQAKSQYTYRIFSSYVVCLEKKKKRYKSNDSLLTSPNYEKFMKLRLETLIAVQQIVIDIINYELAKKQHNLVFIYIDREKKLC